MPDPSKVDIGHVIGLPPAEAVEYFRRKGFQISDDWREVDAQAHAKAFTVSRMARFDLLADTRRIVDRTVAEGRTIERAAAELEAELRKAGWWGRKTITDKQGNKRTVMLGSPHRIRTILRTNIAAAYSAGRYKRQRETIASRPYWQYIAVLDGATRLRHRELHGKVFRADDPVWDTIYPPNGFRCRCRVRSLSERQAKARGLEVSSDAAGFTPDPGWASNPGKHALWREFGEGVKVVSGQPTWKQLGLPHARDLPGAPEPKELSVAATPQQARRTVQAALGLSGETPRRFVETPVERVLLDLDRTAHITDKFSDHRERFANRIIPTLSDPNEVWMAYFDDGTFRKRYLKVFKGGGGRDLGGLSVVVETPDGQLFYNFIPIDPGGVNRNRVGALLYRKQRERKGR